MDERSAELYSLHSARSLRNVSELRIAPLPKNSFTNRTNKPNPSMKKHSVLTKAVTALSVAGIMQLSVYTTSACVVAGTPTVFVNAPCDCHNSDDFGNGACGVADTYNITSVATCTNATTGSESQTTSTPQVGVRLPCVEAPDVDAAIDCASHLGLGTTASLAVFVSENGLEALLNLIISALENHNGYPECAFCTVNTCGVDGSAEGTGLYANKCVPSGDTCPPPEG